MSYNDDRNAANERRGNDGSAAPDDQVQREIQEAKNYLELQELRKRVEEERSRRRAQERKRRATMGKGQNRVEMHLRRPFRLSVLSVL